jgi:MerR family transcriptional regulator/heat shock protein HspR
MGANGEKIHKIGQVAEMLDISVPTLRMYEREGILIPIKSPGGTRYFSESDVRWIRCIRRMITELGLNLEGIRRLLALIPCWELTECGQRAEGGCDVSADATRPCWMKKDVPCKLDSAECYACPAYRYSVNCENLKALFEIRLRQLTASAFNGAKACVR